jgi:hypothetical protein
MAGGQVITSGQGTLTADSPESDAVTGSESTAAAGDVAKNRLHPLRSKKTGGGSATFAISGLASAVSAGLQLPVLSQALSGSVLTGSQGAFAKARTVAASGSVVGVSQSSVTPSTPAVGTLPTLTLHPTATGTLPYFAAVYPSEGAVPSGQGVFSNDDTSLRSTVTSTWPDGSASVVVLSGNTAVTNGVSRAISLRSDTQVSSSPLTTASIAALVSSVVVDCGVTLGSATLTTFTSPSRTWWANQRTICCRYRVQVGADDTLEAVIDIHAFSSGRALVEIVLENCKITSSLPAPTLGISKNYTATVTVNGNSVATVNSSAGPGGSHIATRAWYTSYWVGGDPGITVTHDTVSMQAHPLFYKCFKTPSAITPLAVDTYEPWGLGRHPASDQAATGGSTQISTIPEWEARYLGRGGVNEAKATIASALSILTRNIGYRDSTSGKVISVENINGRRMTNDTWPIASGSDFAGGGAVQPSWEIPHHGAAGLMAFMLRPSPVFIEIAQKVAMWGLAAANSTSTGVFQPGIGQRGEAWSLRSLVHAIHITPDGDTLKTSMRGAVDANMVRYLDYKADANSYLWPIWSNQPTARGLDIWDANDGERGCGQRFWMFHYLVTELIRAARSKVLTSGTSQTNANLAADHIAQQPIRYVTESAAGEWRTTPYNQTIGTVGGGGSTPFVSMLTWAGQQRWRYSAGNPPVEQGSWLESTPPDADTTYANWQNATSSGLSYPSYHWAAISAAIEYTTERASAAGTGAPPVPGVGAAWKRIAEGITNLDTWANGFQATPNFNFYPRTIPTTLPYSIPAAGVGALIGLNNANDQRPTGWTTTTWDYSLFRQYGGGTFCADYSAHGAYVLASTGGHGGPPNFGAAIFDFTTGLWSWLPNANGAPHSRTTDLNLSTEIASDGSVNLPGVIPNSIPTPSHTYSNAAPLSKARGGGNRGSYLMLGTAGISPTPVDRNWAWKLDLETGLWSRYSTNVGSVGATHSPAVYDSVTGRHYKLPGSLHQQTLQYIDPTTLTWTSVPGWPAQQDWGGNVNATFDPRRRLIITRGTSQGQAIRVGSTDALTTPFAAVSVTGSSFPQSGMPTKWEYCPKTDAFYNYPGTGTQIYKLSPPASSPMSSAWTLTAITPTGAVIPTFIEGNGSEHQSKFCYVPSIGCFAWFAGGDKQVYIWNPT